MEIAVLDLSDEVRSVPNPVRTFSEAFQHYRKYYFTKHIVMSYEGVDIL